MVRPHSLTALVAASLVASCSGEAHDGYLAPPRQSNVMGAPIGEDLRQVANFDAEVLVLSRKGYSGLLADDLAEYSPVDFAVAWGDAAREEVYSAVHVSQSYRFYFWQASAQGMADTRVRNFGRESANWHIIPAEKAVADQLWEVREGDVVRLSGYLVDIDGGPRKQWKTSRVRTDTGAGACEIFLVTVAQIRED